MWFKKFTLFIFILSLAAPWVAAQSRSGQTDNTDIETPTIYLRVGQRYPIEGIIAQSADIEPQSIASAHQTPEGLLLTGNHTGQAMLSLESGGHHFEIKVIVDAAEAGSNESKSDERKLWSDALISLKKIPGISISQIGSKILIQGQVLGRKAYRQLLLYRKLFPKRLLVLAKAGPGVKASLIEQATTLLKHQGLNQLSISSAGNRFFLEGRVSTPEQVEQAIATAQQALPDIENHVPIPIRVDPMVSVHIFVLELSKQALTTLGLSWPAMIAQAVTLSPSSLAFAPSWTASLKHLTTKGEAKVLAEPVLAVKSGSQAQLSAGGEIPIRITGRFENKVVWKHYGLTIKLKVNGIAGRYIQTKIDTESSQLDEAASVDGVPGLKTNKMSTSVDVIAGRPILLTGLFQSSAAKDVDKVPLIGDIPILGELFKSRTFRNHQSELLIALLPTFGAQTVRLPLKSTHGLDFDFKWRPLD